MATYSVVTQDGQWFGPADENALADWIRQGRVDRQTMLHCHETNARLTAAGVPALQPMLGLSQQQVTQLLQPPAAPVYGQPQAQPMGYSGGPMAYATPGAYGAVLGAPEHRLTPFPVAGAVLLSVFVPLFGMIYYGLVHGNLPKRRPDDPGAGKAIGFMFIPIFSLYWTCFFWVRLCTRIDDERARAGLPPAAPRGLVIATCWCMLGLIVPIVGIFALLAIVVMSLISLAQIQGSINELCAVAPARQ